MPTATRLRAAEAWARQVCIDVSDPRFNHWVYAVHEDGTTMMIRSAFLMRYPQDEEYVAIIAEHHNVLVYALEDFRGIWELQPVALR